MKILRTSCQIVEMQLKAPYVIAYETISSCRNVFIRAETDSAIMGFGCAAPDLAVTGETEVTVMDSYIKVIEPALKGADPLDYSNIIIELKSFLHKQPAALALADMILYDLAGKSAGLPLYKYLGGTRSSIETSITLGIMPVDELLKLAAEFVNNGFRILKVKGGINVNEDVERIMKLREKYGSSVIIRFDANQGYDLEKSAEFARVTEGSAIEFIEQPTSRYDLQLLGQVAKRIPIPVMADESLMNYRDAENISYNHLADLINIKLMKVGGILESLRINSVASANGIKSMTGCMDESALAIAAGLHFSLSHPNIEYADLDGHLDLLNDPAAGAVILKDGVLFTTGRPGLGFDVRF